MKPYLVISINPANNRVNGGVMFKITLQDLTTGEKFVTYADPNNRNYQNWQPLIANRECGQVIDNVRTTKKRGKTLIDADSRPQHVYCGDAQELAGIVSQHWGQTGNNYNSLFD